MTREEAAQRIVIEMVRVLERWGRARDLLSTDQQLFIAEKFRDVADVIDRGVVVRLATPPARPRRWLVRSHKTERGMPLFRVVAG